MAERIVQNLPIDQVLAAPQVRERFDQESLLSLAMTMKVVGVQQPISVRRSATGYEIIAGERRWRAATLAGLTMIPAIVVEGELSEADIIELQLIENCAREDLNPVEKAKAYDRLMKATQRSAAETARRLGTSPAAVSKLTSLLLLAPDILAHVRNGQIPYSSAYELVKVSDPGEQRRLADEIVARGLTRERLIEQTKARGKAPINPRQARRTRAPRERVVLALGEGRSLTVSAASITLDSLVNWIEELLNRIRSASAEGVALADFIKSLPRR